MASFQRHEKILTLYLTCGKLSGSSDFQAGPGNARAGHSWRETFRRVAQTLSELQVCGKGRVCRGSSHCHLAFPPGHMFSEGITPSLRDSVGSFVISNPGSLLWVTDRHQIRVVVLNPDQRPQKCPKAIAVAARADLPWSMPRQTFQNVYLKSLLCSGNPSH